MLKAIIHPANLRGALTVPGSKSYSQRALAMALLHPGVSRIFQFGKSKDELHVKRMIEALGAIITEIDSGTLEIHGVKKIRSGVSIDCGESALAARLFSCIAALSEEKIVITGIGSLLNRSMDELLDMLTPRVSQINSKNGKLPFAVCGPLQESGQMIQACSGSQHLTGLLIALAFSVSKKTVIQVNGLVSKPYIDLTISMLVNYGCRVDHTDYRLFTILPRVIPQETIQLEIESDWSNAAFWIVAGVLAGPLSLKGLSRDSFQGDKVMLDVVLSAGAGITEDDQGFTFFRSERMRPFRFDAHDFPDLFPPLSILAAYLDGVSVISGVNRLHAKESDRAHSILQMLLSLGIKAEFSGNDLLIYGGKLKGGEVNSYGDHRIVMSAAIAGLAAEGDVTIIGAEVVEKSYPAFFKHLEELGGRLTLNYQNSVQ